jgi:hypothetical protein
VPVDNQEVISLTSSCQGVYFGTRNSSAQLSALRIFVVIIHILLSRAYISDAHDEDMWIIRKSKLNPIQFTLNHCFLDCFFCNLDIYKAEGLYSTYLVHNLAGEMRRLQILNHSHLIFLFFCYGLFNM